MKIVRSIRQMEKEKRKREKALKGCDICPNCGEKFNIDIMEGCNRNTDRGCLIKTYQNRYKCRECNVVWESGKWKEKEF